MKLKLDENGNVVVQDGKPVYVYEDGKEVAFDASNTLETIKRLNREAQGHREAKEELEGKLKAFGDLDPNKANEALKTLQNLDSKKLVDAGEIERLKAELGESYKNSYEPQINEWKSKAEQATQALQKELIGGGFARSKFIQEKISVPVDMVQATFGNNFKIEDGRPVAYDHNGQKIYSRSNPSELANFDEALETLVGGYQYRDSILKGNQSQGGGYQGGNGGQGGQKTMSRDNFTKLNPTEQAQFIQSKGLVTE